MKTTEIKTNDAVKTVTYFADRLRDLVMDALSNGVHLEVPVIEHPALKKKSLHVEQQVVTATIPARWEHPYYTQPLWVRARAVVITAQPHYEESRIVSPKDISVSDTAFGDSAQ